MNTLNQLMFWLFVAIVVGIVVTNPGGVNAVGGALANFTSSTVGAFGSSFAGRA